MITATQFRKELKKIMPGYKWTVHRPSIFTFDETPNHFTATGIQTKGLARMSTLQVTVIGDGKGGVSYTAKSSGYGKRAPWLHSHTDGTLARALRGLQGHYEAMAADYSGHARDLEYGRKVKEVSRAK